MSDDTTTPFDLEAELAELEIADPVLRELDRRIGLHMKVMDVLDDPAVIDRLFDLLGEAIDGDKAAGETLAAELTRLDRAEIARLRAELAAVDEELEALAAGVGALTPSAGRLETAAAALTGSARALANARDDAVLDLVAGVDECEPGQCLLKVARGLVARHLPRRSDLGGIPDGA